MLNFHVTPKEAQAIQNVAAHASLGYLLANGDSAIDEAVYRDGLVKLFGVTIADDLYRARNINLKIHFDRDSIPADQRFSDA